MPVHRFPVVLLSDPAGFHTALPLEAADVNMAGFGSTAKQALGQLREYLEWLYKRNALLPGPDFLEPRLFTVRVRVRPEYRDGPLLHTCEEEELPVHYVAGRQQSELLVAALPLFDIRFSYHDPRALKNLAIRYVQQALRGLTPREVAGFLPPPSVSLDEVVVRVRIAAKTREDDAILPALTQVAEPLGERGLRKQFNPAWERTAEVTETIRCLHRDGGNLLLVGEAGVGKTAVLLEAVKTVERLLADEAKKRGENPQSARRFWLTSAGRLIAGMKYLGQWEERCEQVIEELAGLPGVLVVDRLLDLVRTGGTGPGDSIAAFLMPFLQRGELRLVGEATPAELAACRRLLPGWADLFALIDLPPFDRSRALAVLDRIGERHALNLHIGIDPVVSGRLYQLFRRFLPYQAFPGAAAGFFRDLCERHARAFPNNVLTAEDVVRRFVLRTGLPEWLLRDETPLDQNALLADLRRRVIGQEAGVQAVARVVTTFKAGLSDPKRPLGVLLFCGPTGVGKTELARALAHALFGHGEPASGKSDDRLIRLDMSEFAGFDAVERLLGPPHGEPSPLIRRVRQQPFRVLLLDEIEKASPEVFDVLLGICDEGRLTDRYGRTTTFRGCVILLTSNLGGEQRDPFGFGGRSGGLFVDAVRDFFRPEFFNRLDAVVTFQPLDPDTIHAIARKELATIGSREGFRQSNLRLRWTDRLVVWLAQAGFDARYGARPLQRVLERKVVAPLARYLLAHPQLRDREINLDCTEAGGVLINVR